MKLNENFLQGDFKFLISNIISIDEYNPKYDNNNIVVVLFVNNKKALIELETFFLRKNLPSLKNVEISNLLDENQNYKLFLDFERNKNTFIKDFMKIIKDLSLLTNNKDWFGKIYKKKMLHRLTYENLNRLIDFN